MPQPIEIARRGEFKLRMWVEFEDGGFFLAGKQLWAVGIERSPPRSRSRLAEFIFPAG